MSSSLTNSVRSKASTVDGSSCSMVAAIDLGTSYSGYAYGLRRELDESSDNIIINAEWHSSDKSVKTFKIPTILLLNEKREFEAFGYEAEKRYKDLFLQGRHQRCFFFRRFKTKVFGNQNLKSSWVLKDEIGKAVPALKVFSLSIRFLKGHLLNSLRLRGTDISTDDVKWVITVPGIWSDVAKQFIRQAAIQAGISSEQLKLGLEAELASVYCQSLHSGKVTATGRLPILTAGIKYAVADIGGGKVDVIVHERQTDGKLKELTKGGGGITGGNAVDNAFLQFLVRVFSAPVVREFLDECKLEFLEFLKQFETAKRQVSLKGKRAIEVNIPPSLVRICHQKLNGDSLETVVSKSVYREKVTILRDKMCIDGALSSEFFRSASVEIARQIRQVLHTASAKRTSFLLLVGGFADSVVVQDVLKKELEDGKTKIQRIIVPPDPSLAVLKGAVLFGHQPSAIFSRVIRYTYGLRKARLYNPDMHPEDKKVLLDGVEYITDVFAPFITAGSRAPVAFMSYDSLTTIEPYQKAIEIDVYYSSELNPTYVTDKHCWLLGKVQYPIPAPSKEERTIYIEFIFGGTELILNIIDRKTNSRFKNTFPSIEM